MSVPRNVYIWIRLIIIVVVAKKKTLWYVNSLAHTVISVLSTNIALFEFLYGDISASSLAGVCACST